MKKNKTSQFGGPENPDGVSLLTHLNHQKQSAHLLSSNYLSTMALIQPSIMSTTLTRSSVTLEVKPPTPMLILLVMMILT